MKGVLGWRTAAAALPGVGVVVIGSVWAILEPNSASAKIHMEFYSAAATMLPILLIAHLLRLGRVREFTTGNRAELRVLRDKQRAAVAEIAQLRSDVVTSGSDPELLARIDQLEENAETIPPDRESDPVEAMADSTGELLFGNLIAALILATAAGAASLIALASNTSNSLLLGLTATGLAVVTFGLIFLEIVTFALKAGADAR